MESGSAMHPEAFQFDMHGNLIYQPAPMMMHARMPHMNGMPMPGPPVPMLPPQQPANGTSSVVGSATGNASDAGTASETGAIDPAHAAMLFGTTTLRISYDDSDSSNKPAFYIDDQTILFRVFHSCLVGMGFAPSPLDMQYAAMGMGMPLNMNMPMPHHPQHAHGFVPPPMMHPPPFAHMGGHPHQVQHHSHHSGHMGGHQMRRDMCRKWPNCPFGTRCRFFHPNHDNVSSQTMNGHSQHQQGQQNMASSSSSGAASQGEHAVTGENGLAMKAGEIPSNSYSSPSRYNNNYHHSNGNYQHHHHHSNQHNQHQQFRKKACRNFPDCPYGTKCRFYHPHSNHQQQSQQSQDQHKKPSS